MKRCTACKEVKPVEEFPRNRSKRDGLSTECRPCVREASRRWREQNPERARNSARHSYEKHREKAIADAKAWAIANPDKVRTYRKRSAANANPKHRAVHNRLGQAARRARVKGNNVAYLALLLDDPCAYCGGPGGTLDHIVAVESGGTNAWENLTGACLSCNSSKQSRPLMTYLGDRLAA